MSGCMCNNIQIITLLKKKAYSGVAQREGLYTALSILRFLPPLLLH